MAKDPEDKKLKKDKKDKKEKSSSKEKRADTEGVSKSSKKEKKEKKMKAVVDVDMVDALEAELEKAPEESSIVNIVNGEEPRGALVPFAFPLVEGEKEVKKVLKGVKKSAKTKTLRRGVKEVVKALRKSAPSAPTSDSSSSPPPAIVIIAADISPMDVISHIPVLCEDHNIPYIYIKSRAQLGEASATKRPTSVVMVARERHGKNKDAATGEDADVKEFGEVYAELSKLVAKAGKSVRK